MNKYLLVLPVLIFFLSLSYYSSAVIPMGEPIVTVVTTNSYRIVWKTEEPALGAIELIDRSGKLISKISESKKKPGIEHVILLKNLKQDINYSFYIISNSSQMRFKSELFDMEALVKDTTLPGVITLKWRTESEEDNYGFNLYRSLTKDGPWVKVNDRVIPGHGTTSEPHEYRFTDKGVMKYTQYYYQLEEIDMSGNTKRFPYTIKGMDNKLPG